MGFGVATIGPRSGAALGTAASPWALPVQLALAVALLLGGSGCTEQLKKRALRKQALELCDTIPHHSGDSCRSEVERSFPACGGRYLAQQIDTERYLDCLGFAPNGAAHAPVQVGQCHAPHIIASFSATLAKRAPWEGSAARSVSGRTLYVASSPTLSTDDLRALRLEDDGGRLVVQVTLSQEAAERLAATTGANLGETLIFSLNGSQLTAAIGGVIPGPELVISAETARLHELCKVP